MKGIAHFVAGVAAASCVPEAVRRGAEGDPTLFILGGVFGLLPDTLDFKVSRYFYRHDIEVTPDPARPDAGAMAACVAEAINRAHREGRPVRLKLNTIQTGTDAWQSYTLRFDGERREVVTAFGPVVDTGRNPLPDPPPASGKGRAAVDCAIDLEYLAETPVEILDGPSFEMRPTPRGTVLPAFIPWHRAWSHSLPVALAAGLAAAWLWGAWALVVVAAAVAMHAVFDQLGFMGSALLYPFNRRRFPGLKWMHSGEILPNTTAVWGCCLLILWNLSRAAADDVAPSGRAILLYGLVLPGLALWAYRRLSRAHGGRHAPTLTARPARST